MRFLSDHPALTELEHKHPAAEILEAVQDYASTLDRSPFQDSFFQNSELEKSLLPPLVAHMQQGWGALPLTSENTGGQIALARKAAKQGFLTILMHEGVEYIALGPEGAQQMRDARRNFQINEQSHNPLIRGSKNPKQYRAAEGYSRKDVQQ